MFFYTSCVWIRMYPIPVIGQVKGKFRADSAYPVFVTDF